VFLCEAVFHCCDEQVKHAEDCGAKAVLLYPDPSEVVSPGTASDTYPSGRYLPGWATRRDSLWRFGDPLTPSIPSRGGQLLFSFFLVLHPSLTDMVNECIY